MTYAEFVFLFMLKKQFQEAYIAGARIANVNNNN